MLTRKAVSLALCAVMLLSCIMVTVNADARPLLSDWTVPIAIENGDDHNADQCRMAMDSAGDTLVVWRSGGDLHHVINYTAYTGSWGPVATLSDGEGDCGNPAIAMNDAGNAVVVYSQYDGSHYDVKARYFSGGEWSVPVTIGSDMDRIATPQVAMNASGGAIAVWNATGSVHTDVVGCVYLNGNWDEATTISDGEHDCSSVQLVMNNIGNATVAWCEDHAGANVIAVASLSVDQWSDPEVVSPGSGACAYPDLTINDLGISVLVYQQYSSDLSAWTIIGDVQHNGEWGSPAIISDLGISYTEPKMVIADNMAMGTIWVQTESGDLTSIGVLTSGVGNDGPETLSAIGNVQSPDIVTNSDGNMMATWYDIYDTHSFIISRAYTDGNWGDDMVVTEVSTSAYSPQVAINSYGGAVAIWEQENGDLGHRGVYASTYTPKITPSVSIASPSQDDILTSDSVKVEWTGANVDHYNVSVDGAEAINVSKNTDLTIDDLAEGEHNVNVTAYNVLGESSYAEVSFIVDTAAPAVNVTVPAIGAWYNTSSLNVT
ncbi:MAG: fibronectin type III domain-containing protein, partial [Methanomassiliicoccus sp.]|nr:fibronectin type III domain-containing protein [Methanomassiliicoccus sp.]